MIKASSSFCAFSDTLILFFNFQVIWETTGIIRILGVLMVVPEINVSSPANPLPPCPACRTWYVGKFYSQIFKWLCRASDNASLQTSRTVFSLSAAEDLPGLITDTIFSLHHLHIFFNEEIRMLSTLQFSPCQLYFVQVSILFIFNQKCRNFGSF